MTAEQLLGLLPNDTYQVEGRTVLPTRLKYTYRPRRAPKHVCTTLAAYYRAWPRTQEWILQHAPYHSLLQILAHFTLGVTPTLMALNPKLHGDVFRLHTLPTPECQHIRDEHCTEHYIAQCTHVAHQAQRFLSQYSAQHGGAAHPWQRLIIADIIGPANAAASETRFLCSAIPMYCYIYRADNGARFQLPPPVTSRPPTDATVGRSSSSSDSDDALQQGRTTRASLPTDLDNSSSHATASSVPSLTLVPIAIPPVNTVVRHTRPVQPPPPPPPPMAPAPPPPPMHVLQEDALLDDGDDEPPPLLPVSDDEAEEVLVPATEPQEPDEQHEHHAQHPPADAIPAPPLAGQPPSSSAATNTAGSSGDSYNSEFPPPVSPPPYPDELETHAWDVRPDVRHGAWSPDDIMSVNNFLYLVPDRVMEVHGVPRPAARHQYQFRPRTFQGTLLPATMSRRLAAFFRAWPRTQEWILRHAPYWVILQIAQYFNCGYSTENMGRRFRLWGDVYRLHTLPTPSCQDIRDEQATEQYIKQCTHVAREATRWLGGYSSAHHGACNPYASLIYRHIILPATEAAAETRYLFNAIPWDCYVLTAGDGTRWQMPHYPPHPPPAPATSDSEDDDQPPDEADNNDRQQPSSPSSEHDIKRARTDRAASTMAEDGTHVHHATYQDHTSGDTQHHVRSAPSSTQRPKQVEPHFQLTPYVSPAMAHDNVQRCIDFMATMQRSSYAHGQHHQRHWDHKWPKPIARPDIPLVQLPPRGERHTWTFPHTGLVITYWDDPVVELPTTQPECVPPTVTSPPFSPCVSRCSSLASPSLSKHHQSTDADPALWRVHQSRDDKARYQRAKAQQQRAHKVQAQRINGAKLHVAHALRTPDFKLAPLPGDWIN